MSWSGAVALAAGLLGSASAAPVSADVAGTDWLSTVNTYRAMSGLGPVSENTTWSSEALAHSCYMLQNGISHDEIPGRPGYTSGGDIAGNSGNVAVSSSISATARNHVDLWMTGPFHAIGVLRYSLRTSGFGLCAQENTPTPWRSGGTLDVIRGIDSSAVRPSTPILFPGDGATVPLHSFITEFPNPLDDVRVDGRRGPAADRDDAERRDLRDDVADRPERPDHDLRPPQGQHLGRDGASRSSTATTPSS